MMQEPNVNIVSIIPFPLDRELRLIRETARQLERRDGERANKYFRTECNRIYARLQVLGFDHGTIEEQVDRFASAVQLELQKMAMCATGGAA